MKKMELELGKEITYPIYISSVILKQKPDKFGGITVDNEKEIFIERPLTEEKEIQTELGGYEIVNREEQLKEKDNKINQLRQKVEELEKKQFTEEEKKLIDHISLFLNIVTMQKFNDDYKEKC